MKKGSKVVCINDKFDNKQKELIKYLPKLNNTYTVREIIPVFSQVNSNSKFAVLLAEIVNPFIPDTTGNFLFEPSFQTIRFKELEDIELKSVFVQEKELQLI